MVVSQSTNQTCPDINTVSVNTFKVMQKEEDSGGEKKTTESLGGSVAWILFPSSSLSRAVRGEGGGGRGERGPARLSDRGFTGGWTSISISFSCNEYLNRD